MLWKMIPNISATQVARLHLEKVTLVTSGFAPAFAGLLNFSSPLISDAQEAFRDGG